MKIDNSFLGRGWSFPPEFIRGGSKVTMVSREQDIEESLQILLATEPGERIMQPDFGCNIRSLLFDDFSLSSQTIAKEMISRAILFFESRVVVHGISFNTEYLSDGYIQIIIDYSVRSTNTRFNMVFPYYLREGTGIN